MGYAGDKRTGQAWREAALACAVAAAMSAMWAWRDWGNLSQLILPDPDDMMRLQQVRDWLGGQPFADLTQHRLGWGQGLAMHWSRLGDLGIAAGTMLFAPLGLHGAQLAAVIAYPAMLFALALFLIARVTALLAGPVPARIALVVGALAYPATAMFLPGRIDHHGLQIVLLLTAVLAKVRPPRFMTGVIAGIGVAASLVVGLETAPLLAALLALAVFDWIARTPGAGDRLAGLAAGLGGATMFALALLRPEIWPVRLCDGFTPASSHAMLTGAAALLALAAADRIARTSLARAIATAGVAAFALILLSQAAAPCLANPYRDVDPLVARLWLNRVAEARPLLAQPFATILGYAGLMVCGLLATIARAVEPAPVRRGWVALAALLVVGIALTLLQARAAAAGAMLAVPALAAAVAQARVAGRPLPLVGAWIASAGTGWALAGAMIAPSAAAPAHAGPSAPDCINPQALAALRRFGTARLLAPIDLGGYAIAATDLHVVAAPYHRNNAGNAADLRFFDGPPIDARAIAARWHVDLVAICDADGPDPLALPGSMADGARPTWLIPAGAAPGLHIYRVAS